MSFDNTRTLGAGPPQNILPMCSLSSIQGKMKKRGEKGFLLSEGKCPEQPGGLPLGFH